jgi:kynureninase
MDLPIVLGDKVASLIGADSGEVVVCDSTSVNAFKALWAAISITDNRSVLLTDRTNFPTDIYIAQGLASMFDGKLEVRTIELDNLEHDIGTDVGVLFLTHVDFRTGARYDMKHISQLAHNYGVLVIWDLSHSAGVMPIHLKEAGADFAVGCGYKYLNGGPGAPGYVYVASKWHDQVSTPLTGWMGHALPFDFSVDYVPASGIRQMLCGSPPILSMTALDVGVDLLRRADLEDVRRKSVKLTSLFMETLYDYEAKYGFSILTPTKDEDRGSQVSISHPSAARILDLLGSKGLIADFRPPDLLRFGFSPLYTRYTDVWDAANILLKVLKGLD